MSNRTDKLKVTIVTHGKFHNFHLARFLHEKELLSKIFTRYPLYKLKDQGLPMNKIYSVPELFLICNILNKISLGKSLLYRELNWKSAIALSKGSADKIHYDSDVVIALSGAGLEVGKYIKNRGGIYICDRGSSHIRFQNDLLTEEYMRWNQVFRRDDMRVIEREEEEYENSDRIFTPSAFTQESFIKSGINKDKIVKIAYGADINRFYRCGIPSEDHFDVLYVGRVSLRKGFPYLLKAFENFKHPYKRLKVVGSVSQDVVQYIQDFKPCLENVEFIGKVPHDRLRFIMSSSQVMVLPSIEEGLALVQGEAMACGCPVISTFNAGGIDLFQSGVEGFIVPIRESTPITELFTRLADDSNLAQQMREAAIIRVQAIGGWEQYGASVVAAIENIMKIKK